MGYCMDLMEQNFEIKAENKAGALAAIKALAGNETISNSFGKHFSWVNTEDFLNAETLEDALRVWRWDGHSTSPEADIYGIEFIREKAGDDKILFDAIAPFVVEGSYIQMRGEDGAMWRWEFDGETCDERFATVIWE